MRKVFLYLDDFNIISNEVMKNLNYLKELKSKNPQIKKIIILIRQEKMDFLTPTERKNFIEKCLENDSNFIVKSTNLEKTFKIMKKIEGQNIVIEKIFVNEVDEDYIKNGLKGLPIQVESFKNYDNIHDTIVQHIKNNDYQNYVKMVPMQMYSEFEWLKEKMNHLIDENLFTEILDIIERG